MRKKDFLWSLLIILIATTIGLNLTACDGDDDPYANVSDNSLTFESSGGSKSLTISSNTNWMISSSESWCQLSTTSGSKDGSVVVSVNSNNDSSERTCILTIMAGDIQKTVSVKQSAPNLSVTPTDISLLSNSGSSASITINTTASWSASCNADWINLSSRSGNGNTNLTVTALSDNASAEDRTTIVTIQIGAITQNVSVTQKAKYIKAYVDIDRDHIVALTTDIAVRQTYRGAVSYYYSALLLKSASAGWTDDKVLSEITTKFDAEKPGDDGEDVFGIPDLSAGSTYILFTVAYNEKGEHGPLQRFEITTPSVVNNRPRVNYGSITYYTSSWEWSTTIGPYAKRYYMIAADDTQAYNYMVYYNDALVAYMIKERVDRGNLTPIVNSGKWSMDRTPNSIYFYSASWAVDDDGKYAGELDSAGGSISSSARSVTTTKKKQSKSQIVSYQKLMRDWSSTKLFLLTE